MSVNLERDTEAESELVALFQSSGGLAALQSAIDDVIEGALLEEAGPTCGGGQLP